MEKNKIAIFLFIKSSKKEKKEKKKKKHSLREKIPRTLRLKIENNEKNNKTNSIVY